MGNGAGVWQVMKMLGDNHRSIGSLCRSDKIKKWSLRKPIRSSKLILTEDDFMEANYGFDMEDAKVSTPQQAIAKLNAGYDWVYLTPRGISFNEYFRILDFEDYDTNAVNWFGRWGIVEGAGAYVNLSPSEFVQNKQYKLHMETPFNVLYNRMKVWYSKPTNGLFFGVLAWSPDGDIYFLKHGTFASVPSMTGKYLMIEPPVDIPLKSFKFAPIATTCASGTASTSDIDGNYILKWNKVNGTMEGTWNGDWWVMPVTPFETRISASVTGLPEVWQKYAQCGIYENQLGGEAIKITRTGSGYDIKFYIKIAAKTYDKVTYNITAKVFADSSTTAIKVGSAYNKTISQGQQTWIGSDLSLSNSSDSLYQFDDGYVGFQISGVRNKFEVQFEINANVEAYNKSGYKYLVFQNGETMLPTNIGSSITISNPTITYS